MGALARCWETTPEKSGKSACGSHPWLLHPQQLRAIFVRCAPVFVVFFPTVSGYNQQLQPCGGCLWQAGIFFKSIFSCLGWTAERLCEWMSDHVPGMVQTSVSSWPVVAQAAVTSVGNLSLHFSTLFSLKFSVGVLGKRSTLARCRIWYSGI